MVSSLAHTRQLCLLIGKVRERRPNGWTLSSIRTILKITLCNGEPCRVNIVRLGEHTDYGPMTLLYQDNIGGLEVKCPKTSKWVGITPNENAIILNMGDLFEIMTSGHIPAAL